MAQVSTAEGVVGQRQGFNISTAELAFVADTQAKVTQAITEVQTKNKPILTKVISTRPIVLTTNCRS